MLLRMKITLDHRLPTPNSYPSDFLAQEKFFSNQCDIFCENIGPQPSKWRSDAVTRRHPDDAEHHRDRQAARHQRPRPHHRRQRRPHELQGIAADLEHDPEKWAPVFGKDHAQKKLSDGSDSTELDQTLARTRRRGLTASARYRRSPAAGGRSRHRPPRSATTRRRRAPTAIRPPASTSA